MVYLIDLGTCYKIGITNNLKKRVESFKNSREIVIPIDIIVYPHNTINIEKIDKDIENELHILCKKYKISRELFQKIPDVIQIFSDYKINKIKDLIDWKEQFEEILNPPKKEKVKKEKIGKTIYQYDLKGNLIKEWNGTTQIQKELGFEHKGIDNALQGIYNKSHGYIWSLTKLTEKDLQIKIKNATKYNNCSKILQYSKDNILLEQYNSITEASEKTGISISSISLCCNGKYKTAGSYIWKREE